MDELTFLRSQMAESGVESLQVGYKYPMARMLFRVSDTTFILMMPVQKYGSIATSFLQQFQQWQFAFFTLLTLFSILSGQSTVFYVIYFFWWTEFIRLLVDGLLYRQNPNAERVSKTDNSIISSFVPMFIYLVFIVVFFGIIANLHNESISFINIQVLVFQNWFFNLNLLILLIHRIVLHRTQQPVKLHFGAFTPNMIVLHVSIVVGGVLMFFVVRNYPQTFTPDNRIPPANYTLKVPIIFCSGVGGVRRCG